MVNEVTAAKPMAAVRITKRRAETRQRLLDAALPVFAERGLGRATVEEICDQAGYSRGAFYSNFDSLDMLFLALWQYRSDSSIRAVTAALDAAYLRDGRPTLEQTVELLVDALPLDRQWFLVSVEFVAYAARNPELRQALAEYHRSLIEAVLPLIDTSLARIGRRPVQGLDELGRAITVIHQGTQQALVNSSTETVRALRRRLLMLVIQGLSEPIPTL